MLPSGKPEVYVFCEFGVTYELNYEQFNTLKKSYSETIEGWYNGLDKFTKKEIVRTGNIQEIDNGFYPDV